MIAFLCAFQFWLNLLSPVTSMNEIPQIKCQCEVSQQASCVHMSRRYPAATILRYFHAFYYAK